MYNCVLNDGSIYNFHINGNDRAVFANYYNLIIYNHPCARSWSKSTPWLDQHLNPGEVPYKKFCTELYDEPADLET